MKFFPIRLRLRQEKQNYKSKTKTKTKSKVSIQILLYNSLDCLHHSETLPKSFPYIYADTSVNALMDMLEEPVMTNEFRNEKIVISRVFIKD
jgi:hypothetical protein